MSDKLFEVLHCRPDGHETITRVTASSKTAAQQAVVELGVPSEEIVSVEPYGGQ